MTPFSDRKVEAVFARYPARPRRKLLALRELIFRTAAKTDGVGTLEETLKWGEPSYLTSETGTGTTVRIGWKETEPRAYSMYFHCQTTLIPEFRRKFPRTFTYDGKRRIVFDVGEPLAKRELAECVQAALTYHSRKKRK